MVRIQDGPLQGLDATLDPCPVPSTAYPNVGCVVWACSQDLAWLMDAHRKEINDAHKKNQELIQQVGRAGDQLQAPAAARDDP